MRQGSITGADPFLVETVDGVRNRFGRAGLLTIIALAQEELVGVVSGDGFRDVPEGPSLVQ